MKRKYIAVGLLVCVALTGCRTSVNTVENADKDGVPNFIQDRRVITDTRMANRVNVTAINTATTDNGFLRVQVLLTNRSNSQQTIFYSLEWYDGDGMIVSTASGGWTQQQFMARETRAFTFTAPNPRAKDFVIKLMANPR